jgi:hypothetical protein
MEYDYLHWFYISKNVDSTLSFFEWMFSRGPRILNFGFILLNWPQSSEKSGFWMILAVGNQVPKTWYVEKREIQFWLLLDFTVCFCKSYFFACSPQRFTASRWSKFNLLEHFNRQMNILLVSTLQNHFHLEFLKNLFPIKFW